MEKILVYPETKLYVHNIGKFFDAKPSSVEGIFMAEGIVLPGNNTEHDLIYVLEVYTNGNPTGLKTTVTVAPVDVVYKFYEIAGANASPDILVHEGGDVVVNVKFKLPTEG